MGIGGTVAGIALAVLAAACAGPVAGLYPPGPSAPCKTVWVAGHGWHTGIIIDTRDLAEGALAAVGAFPGQRYLDFGWGDEEFYRAEEVGVGRALKAALWPTDAVMHVTAFTAAPADYFPASEVIAIGLSEAGFRALVAALDDSFAPGADGALVPLGPGKYRFSEFFAARGTYFLLNTCNNWTAGTLRAAGYPITRAYAMRAANVMAQVKRAKPTACPKGSLGSDPN